jgi:ribose transport system ATP-binding protein
MPFLRVHNLSKTYPGVRALERVSFDVEAGKVHALVGENGAGKSTLIKILAGAVKPDPGGQIWLQGDPYAPRDPKDALQASVSTIYQVFNLLPERTVMHNILLGKEPARMGLLDLEAMRAEAARVLATLEASHITPDALVGNLKVGEKQVVEIAKALVNRSRLLIMDEPTAALNQGEAEALFENIRRLRLAGVTVLYVSHRLGEIFELADAVSVLRDGEHISTHPINEVSRDSLILDMIGRRLENVFPEREEPIGGALLRVAGLTSGETLREVDLTLHRGEVLAVAGLSGSGKTELGKAIFGAFPIDRGKFWINGVAYQPSPPRAIRDRLIFLPEDRKTDGVLPELSVRRNISLSVLRAEIANRLGIFSPGAEREVVQAQIDHLDIKTTSMDQNVLTLSGGNQQKVVLGRCLAANPEVFILMEPTQGIDIGVKFEIYQFITRQARQGKGILLISSELTEILGLAHRVLVMHDGAVAADLDARRTTQEEILRYALGEFSRAEGPSPEGPSTP